MEHLSSLIWFKVVVGATLLKPHGGHQIVEGRNLQYEFVVFEATGNLLDLHDRELRRDR